MKKQKKLLCAVIALAIVLTSIIVPSTAKAKTRDDYIKQSPSGNVRVDDVKVGNNDYDLDAFRKYSLSGKLSAKNGVKRVDIVLYKGDSSHPFVSNGFEFARATQKEVRIENQPGMVNCIKFESLDPGDYKLIISVSDAQYDRAYIIKYLTIKKNANAYVLRLYKSVLGINPDQGGFDGWTSLLKNRSMSASQVARGFYGSPEYREKARRENISNDQFIRSLYNGLFGRDPDPVGYQGWMGVLGYNSRDYVMEQFFKSEEFIKMCSEYGMLR